MQRQHIESFIVDGHDYFTARLRTGWVRIGLVGFQCFDFPPNHARSAEVSAIANEAEAEAYFDRLYAASL